MAAALCLFTASSWAATARAQACPSAYAACDNGGCCLDSEQCCPTLPEGCCSAYTPFCCGDGTCAAAPGDCANIGRHTCTGYDIPCGGGCAPAGSQCCDLVGHYCPPQAICTAETACRAGDVDWMAKLFIVTSAPDSPAVPERTRSPLLDPADGTDRSCALGPARLGQGAGRVGALPLSLFAAGATAAVRRRARRARRRTPG